MTEELKTASKERHYKITQNDLPLCCPTPKMRLWDSHPRVYLPIEKTGEEVCPYCGARFTLIGFEKSDKTG